MGEVAGSLAGLVGKPVGLLCPGDCGGESRSAGLEGAGEPGGTGLVAARHGRADTRGDRAGDPGLEPLPESAPGAQSRRPDGRLQCVGAVGVIQYNVALSNTNSWRGMANVTLSVPTELWFDVQPANQPQRYYRVVPGPIPIP